MRVETEFGIYNGCWLFFGEYCADGSMAIEIRNAEEGAIAGITVCLNDQNLKYDEGFLDTNNCPWAKEFVEKYKLGKDTGLRRESGYCTYPLYKWNVSEIEKYTEVGMK